MPFEDKVYGSIAELVGSTPLVELHGLERELGLGASVLAKLEFFNPSGSVKDRIALGMIEGAEAAGTLHPGDTILDFTSGNTGISFAAICNARGYRFVSVIQPGVSEERSQILKAYGAELLQFSDIPGVPELMANEGLVFEKFFALLKAYADARGYVYLNQGVSLDNPLSHYRTTGPEIWRATGGNVDGLVALVGTAGTLVGTGKYLREQNPDLLLVGAQPALESRKDPAHPERNTIDGVVPFVGVPQGRMPLYLDRMNVHPDEVLDLDADEAYAMGRTLTRTDGIFLGQSAAAAVLAAAKLAQRPEMAGKTIVAICADNAFKYLSTNIYR